MTLSLVAAMVAADVQEGIARGGDLPWRLPGDLRRMKVLTTGRGDNAVLMGRTTFLTLPGALPKRKNLVLSRRADLTLPDATVVPSWQAALDAAERAGCRELWVLGGAEVYALALAQPELTRVDLTRVAADFACDVRWPGVPGHFRLARVSEDHDEGGTRFHYETWERQAPARAAPTGDQRQDS